MFMFPMTWVKKKVWYLIFIGWEGWDALMSFFRCSCVLSSRMKLPCRHIMNIVRGNAIDMFVLRCLILYHHVLLKGEFDKLTELFRKMEAEEFARNWEIGETIYVNNFVYSSSSSNYPVKINSASDIDVGNMNLMIKVEGGE